MSWVVFLYFPVACLAMGAVGWWVLRSSRNLHALSLHLSRWLLVLFPFLLALSCLVKRFGPALWCRLAGPLTGRNLVLGVLFILVLLRWVAEVTAWHAFQELELGPGMAREARPPLRTEFEALLGLQGGPFWRRMLPAPRLYLSKATVLADFGSGLQPRVCLEAGFVHREDRDVSWWWESVPDFQESREGVRAVLAHELGHFFQWDHVRRVLLSLSAAILPWEWFTGQPTLGKFPATSTWLFKRWSALMIWVGTPIRAWIREDERIRECLADEVASGLVPGARGHLARIRSLYPGFSGPNPNQVRKGGPGLLGHVFLWSTAALLLGWAPGRIPLTFTLRSAMETTNLPRSWCLVAAQGSEASAVFLPGKNESGTIVVKCPKISLGQPSLLRGMGRIPPGCLPGECDIEMVWEVHYQGPGALSGKEAFLSVTQSAMTVRMNLDPFTAYSLPRPLESSGRGSGWMRFASVTKIRNRPDLEHMLIGFNLSAPGDYLFKPPALQIVLPTGERVAFPLGV